LIEHLPKIGPSSLRGLASAVERDVKRVYEEMSASWRRTTKGKLRRLAWPIYGGNKIAAALSGVSTSLRLEESTRQLPNDFVPLPGKAPTEFGRRSNCVRRGKEFASSPTLPVIPLKPTPTRTAPFATLLTASTMDGKSAVSATKP